MNQTTKVIALIIDDSAPARKLLRLMISEFFPNIAIADEAANGLEAIALIKKHKPDFILLDIEMPELTGLQLVEKLIDTGISFEIIFTTAYNEYAIQAFRLSAADYLLKPIKENELIDAINKVLNKRNLIESDRKLNFLAQNFKQEKPNVLCIPILNGVEYIPVSEIEYVEASGSYATVALTDGKHKTVSKNLKFFEESLIHFWQFVRVHRSFIINIEMLKAFTKTDSGTIVLKSGKSVSLARDRKDAFLEKLALLNK